METLSRAIALDASFTTAYIFLKYLESLNRQGVQLNSMYEFFCYLGVATTSFAIGTAAITATASAIATFGMIASAPLAVIGTVAVCAGITLWREEEC